MNFPKMDEDIKDVAKRLIQGNEKRKKRIRQHRQSDFDLVAAKAIADALASSCGNIEAPTIRKQMQDAIYRSIVYSTPYEYMGAVCCGRRQFYEYRNAFIMAVADNLGMVPAGQQDNGTHTAAVKAGQK